MKRFLALAACAAFVTTNILAQTVQIKTASGEVKTYNLSQIESITFSDEPNTEDMVSLDVTNVCAYSFDLKVDKSASCQKYMAAVFSKDVFNETSFVESAIQTLDANAYYRPFANTLSIESAAFSEAKTGLNAVASEDGKTAPQFVAAVYAIDDMGEAKVYTKEFSVPAKATVESTETATVEINQKTLAFNHLDFTVRCGWNTAKVIYAVTQPNYIDSKLTAAKWNALTSEEQQEKLLSVFQGIPTPYQSGLKGSYDCGANTTCIVYAIPIDREGKIGNIGIKTITTGDIPVNGKGAFTGVTAVEQTEWDSYSFNIAVDENAVAYRLMWFTETDEKNSDYIKRLPELFYDSKYEDYGMWVEHPAQETAVTFDIYRPGDSFYLYGVTIDRFGTMSQPVNLGEQFLGKKTIPTISRPSED